MIFETDEKGLDNVLKFWNNPEGRINNNYSQPKIHLNIREGKSHPYWIKVLATDKINQATYDNLTLQLLYNEVKFHNIKFYIPQDETENVEKFLFDEKNKNNKKNKYYLQHMKRDTENSSEKKVYTAKMSCHKNATKQDIINLTSFMRQYL
jgi:hypothetical protein